MIIYSYIAGGIVVAALGAIVFIYAKKFQKAKSIDVATIPEEKQAIVRDRILINRMSRRAEKGKSALSKFFSPIGRAIKNSASKLADKLAALEKKYQRESQQRPQAKDGAFEEKMKGVLLEAEDYLKNQDYSEAEKKYIEVISFDQANKRAYCGLVEVYAAQKEFQQAIQTMNYIIKLDLKSAKPIEKIDEKNKKYKSFDNVDELTADYLRLGELNLTVGEPKKAIANFKKSIAINPNDTKTLDLLINASIMLKEKAAALSYLNELTRVNPDNQKIFEYRKKLEDMRK
jgi:tetratricopeptide (TPR) repeat protein